MLSRFETFKLQLMAVGNALFCLNIHSVSSYKERLYKERLVEHENHKERTLVKLGRVKEHPQLTHVFSQWNGVEMASIAVNLG